MLPKILKYGVSGALALFVAIQFIQPERTNPPADPATGFETVAKPSPEVAAIVRRACYDCHSHATVWPWYSKIAPVSWLVADDVKDGRAHLNFSQWHLFSEEMSRTKLREVCGEVRKGGMPLWQYKLLHSEAQLTEQDIKTLCDAAATPSAQAQPR